jgi:serine/threonine-protein kinase
VGGWFAWRNWRLSRANARGAALLVACFVGLALVGWLLAAKHVPSPGNELAMFAAVLGRALVDGLLLWLAYMGLEPWVRRRSPWRMIAWNRLLEGGWRDPLVGRDVLLGVLGGVMFMVLHQLLFALPNWLGLPPCLYYPWDVTYTEGVATIFLTAQYSLMTSLRDFFLFFLLLLVVRREWLAAVLLVAILLTPWLFGVEYLWLSALTGFIFFALGLLLLFRAGLLAFVAYHVAADLLTYLPLTTDLSAWYSGVSTLGLLTVAGLAVYGFWFACGGRALFTPGAAEE